MENFTGEYDIGTDENGRFTFVNLPPNVQYNLYGIMNTLRPYGTISQTQISTGADGSKADAGDINVTPGHRLAGKVVLSDGKPVPRQTRLMIGMDQAWDSTETVLDENGHFAVAGLPDGVVNMSVRVSGYFLSFKNASHDQLNPRMLGRVDHDITNLTILLDKGREPERDYQSYDPDNRTEQFPLAGIEGGSRRPREQAWQISGRVLDSKTGQPVANCKLTPGNRRFRQVNFDAGNEVTSPDGSFTVSLRKRYADPLVKVEADGYIPAAIITPQQDRTNFDIKLQAGDGPSGVVVTSDGKPAVGVSVALVCAGQQNFQVRDFKVTAWRKKEMVQTTDTNGHFAFRPELEMENVAALSKDGFKMVAVADLAANPKMNLEAWGTVKGTLHRPSGPGTNEELDLAFPNDIMANRWALDLGNHTTTDNKGAFEFDHVPAGKLEMTYRVKMGDTRFAGWREEPLQEVTVAPGQTVELKIDAGKREVADAQMFVNRYKPAKRIGPAVTGTVLQPDGKPAAGAQVGLIVSNEYLGLGKLTLQTGQDQSLKVTTGGDGGFTLPGVAGTHGLVAVHDTGFAEDHRNADQQTADGQIAAMGRDSRHVAHRQTPGHERISVTATL